jgi:hypothetical protein
VKYFLIFVRLDSMSQSNSHFDVIPAQSERSKHLKRLKPMRFEAVEQWRGPGVLFENLGSVLAPTYVESVAKSLTWLSPGVCIEQWQIYEIEGGGCFCAPQGIEGFVRLHRSDSYFDVQLETVAAGMCATMLANNWLQHKYADKYIRVKELERQAVRLEKLAIRHVDGPSIRRVLD